MSSGAKTEKSLLISIGVPLSIFGIIVAVVFVVAILPRLYWGENQPGWIKDSFDLAAVIFSALAFGGVIYTILLQKEELRLQRQELEDTRHELARSADAQQKTEQILLLSAMLSAQTTLLENIKARASHEIATSQWFQPSRIQHEEMLASLAYLVSHLRQQMEATPGIVKWPSVCAAAASKMVLLGRQLKAQITNDPNPTLIGSHEGLEKLLNEVRACAAGLDPNAPGSQRQLQQLLLGFITNCERLVPKEAKHDEAHKNRKLAIQSLADSLVNIEHFNLS